MSFNTVTGAKRFAIQQWTGGLHDHGDDGLGFTAAQSYTLNVNSAVTLAPSTLNPGQVGTPYSQTFTASGGSGLGYTYTYVGNPIPGLPFSGASISGTPTSAGSYPFSITAKDSLGGVSYQ